jgi:hypothetical protein
MSADIIILGGPAKAIASPGKPDKNVVEAIEGLLEAAKSGRVSGIAYCVVYSDDSVTGYYCGQCCRAQVGSLFAVMGRISREIDP